MRMSNSSLAFLLLLPLFGTSFSRNTANHLEANKLDDDSSGCKLGLRVLLQSDTPPSPSDNNSDPPTSSADGPNYSTDTPSSPSDNPPSYKVPTNPDTPSMDDRPNTYPTAPSPPASNSHKLTIILGTSIPTSVVFTTILAILARRRHNKRKSAKAKAVKTGGSHGAQGKDVIVEVAVNFGGADKQ